MPFELEGLKFTALNNGGPEFKFNKAVSFVVKCSDQSEIDHYCERLTSDGGKEIACGWLEDRFGLAWLLVPQNIVQLLERPEVMQAMMQVNKFILADLEAAAKA